MKVTAWILAAVFCSGSLMAHEVTMATFNPPHGGGFSKFGGDYAELYLQGGQIHFCFLEGDGTPSENIEKVKNLVLTVHPKGGKTVIFKQMKMADSAANKDMGIMQGMAGKDGCFAWDFKTTAKLLTVEVKASVEGKVAKAKIAYEVKDTDK